MSWHVVDGVPLPDPVAGHPALDFCNTRAGWGSPAPKEYLTGHRALTLWTREAGLLDPAVADPLLGLPDDGPPGVDVLTGNDVLTGVDVLTGNDLTGNDVLAGAVGLRDALYAAALGTGTRADWLLLSRWAARARSSSRLAPGPDGGPARWLLTPGAVPPVPAVELPLLAVAGCAADFLTSTPAGTVGACPGVGCGWLFTDPRRRRRWCSMAVCGNRAKARRHAERRSGT